MIRHICMFTLKEESKAKNRAETLRPIEGLLAMDVVTNDPATLASNYDFADVAALNTYQTSSIHVAFGQYLGTIRKDRACIDYHF